MSQYRASFYNAYTLSNPGLLMIMTTMKSGQDTQISLDQLKKGECARIERYLGSGDLQGRLKELGLVRGTLVVLERFAPLGDPLEITVRGYHLAIRKKDASQILVCRVEKKNNAVS